MTEQTQADNIVLYIVMAVYIVSIGLIGIVASKWKKQATEEGGDELKAHFGGGFNPFLLVLTTFSSVFSGYTVVGIPQGASKDGFESLRWIAVTSAISLGMLILFPRLRRLAVTKGYTSPNDFLSDRYRSKLLTALGAICAGAPQLFYLTVQCVSFAELMEGVTLGAVTKPVGMVSFAIVILVMEKVGGMHSVVLTDAVQALTMVFGFGVLTLMILIYYGSLPALAAADCDSLGYANRTGLSYNQQPPPCTLEEGPTSDDCHVYGCIPVTAPYMLEVPPYEYAFSYAWFVLNHFAFALNPHMIQRSYIAKTDGALRMVIIVLAVAAFFTMVPGIYTGIVTSTFRPSWPPSAMDETAYSAITNQIKQKGPFEYMLVAILTCSSLAAIMSTADSVILGVSNALSVDVFKGVLMPTASGHQVVMFGTVLSIVMTAIAVGAGLLITSDEFSTISLLQNGFLWQIAPAYYLGLYTNVTTKAVTSGIVAGLVSLPVAFYLFPGQQYFPPVNISSAVNLFVVIAVYATEGYQFPKVELDEYGKNMQERFKDQPNVVSLQRAMAGVKQTDTRILALCILSLLLGIPFWRDLFEPGPLIGGIAPWSVPTFVMSVATSALAVMATLSWRPVPEATPDPSMAPKITSNVSMASLLTLTTRSMVM